MATISCSLGQIWLLYGSFGFAMDILARLRMAKIRNMARPNSPDLSPKPTRKVRLGRNSALGMH